MIKKVRIAVDHGNRNMKTCSQVFTTGLTIQDTEQWACYHQGINRTT